MGPQLGPDLRHVMIGTSRQHTGGSSVGAGEGSLLTELGNLPLKDAHSSLKVIVGVRHSPGAYCAASGRGGQASRIAMAATTAASARVIRNRRSWRCH